MYVGNSPINWMDPLGLAVCPNDITLPEDGDVNTPGPGWEEDPSHKDPNGKRFRHPDEPNRLLDWNKGRPGKSGFKGKDHWHDPTYFPGKHLRPGDVVPGVTPAQMSALAIVAIMGVVIIGILTGITKPSFP